MAKRLTQIIMVALVLGIIVGAVLHEIYDEATLKAIADGFSVVTKAFLRLIKMIIAPLVFATLVSGIGHMGDTAALGRIGVRTMLWFLAASVLSLALGILMVNFLQPGVGLGLPLPPVTADAGIKAAEFAWSKFILDLIPTSIFDAMANNTILQIVVFSLFTGVALTAIGEKGAPILRGVESLMHLMLQITGYVMLFAPFAVFAAVAAVVAVNGLEVLVTYVKFIGGFYLALAILWAILIGLAVIMLGTKRGLALPSYIRAPVLLAFSTASSEAAFPKTLEQLERFGVPNRIAGFVLPLGYSFNLDGSMMYCAFAVIFIAQAYGIDLTIAQEITMLLILLVTSKGMAAVPRASLVVIALTLTQFGIPEAGLLLILGVDQFLDMGRSATNVVGNAVATTVVAKWEGKLQEMQPADGPRPEAPSGTIHDGRRGLNLDADA
jgi:Na+/H+-dicarboxylate symporter